MNLILTSDHWRPSVRYGYDTKTCLGRAMLFAHAFNGFMPSGKRKEENERIKIEKANRPPLKLNWKRQRGTEIYIERCPEIFLTNFKVIHAFD